MIRCDVCGDYYPAREMWIIGPFPLFTYFDSTMCNDCFEPLLRFIEGNQLRLDIDEFYGDSLYFTNFVEMRDSLCKSGVVNGWMLERECPVCEGIMGEGYNEEWDCISFTCLNCGHEVLKNEEEMI